MYRKIYKGEVSGCMKKRIRIYRTCLVGMLIATVMFTVYYANNVIKLDITKGLEDNNNIVRSVSESELDELRVLPLGMQIGVYLETEGVLVAATSSITGADGMNYEPVLNKIYEGDYIVKLNNIDVSSKSQLLFLINKYGSKDLVLTVRRNNEEFDVLVTPVKTANNEYKIGVWARDDTQGIGTLTYVTENGEFGALGHGINDVDTNELLSSNNGLLYKAEIWGITKGQNGSPGGLCGSIDYEKSNELGVISRNCDKGIFGTINESCLDEMKDLYGEDYYEVAEKKEVHKGKAEIISCISGESTRYEIEIVEIKGDENSNKSIVLVVTDAKLLELTNGIVQGMSGSPIIQDGKIIGAVTHVLVNDPTRGYGIFIEDMLKH